MAIIVKRRPYPVSFSGNPVYYQLYSVDAAANSSNYFEVRVMFKPIGGAYSEVTKLEYSPTAGSVDVDIKDICHAKLVAGVPEFFVDETTPWSTDKQSGYFYLEFREITAQNANPTWSASEAAHEVFVIKAGLDYWAWQGNNFWVNYYTTNKPFLTWQENGRMAAETERMYLAWLNLTNSADLCVKVKAIYSDNTASAEQVVALPAPVYGLVYYIPAGCTQWNLQTLNPGKTLVGWQVRIVDNSAGADATEIFNYELRNAHDYNDTFLHYRNSLGGLDSVQIRGVIETSLQYDYTEQESIFAPNYFEGNVIQPMRRITDATEKQTFKGDIGHLGKNEQNRLRDAFLKREVYQCINKKWRPVIISTKTNKLRSSTDQRFTMPIEWELADTGSEFFTPMDMMDSIGGGVFTDNVCMAKISPVGVAVDVSGADALLTISGIEDDPQNAAVKFEYQVVNYNTGDVAIIWTQKQISDLPIQVHAPKGIKYKVQLRPICGDNVPGIITETIADTTTNSPGGWVPGGAAPGSSTVVNNTSQSAAIVVRYYNAAAAVVATATIGSNNQTQLVLPDLNPADQVIIEITQVVPSAVYLESNGQKTTGQLTNYTDKVVAAFYYVTIVNGAIITLN